MTDQPPPDPALLDLFRAELETHLATLNAGVLSLEKAPDDPKRLESLMRAAHSIKGAAKIVGFDPVVQVSHHLEDCFVAAQRGQIQLTSDGVDVLLRGVDALARLGTPPDATGGDRGGSSADLEPLIAEIAAVRSGRPPIPRPTPPTAPPPPPVAPATPAASAPTLASPPAPAATFSQSAIYEFVSEAKEHLSGVVQDLLALEKQPREADEQRIDRLFRGMHSVKGGAGFVGCQAIEELAHAMESVLEDLRQTGIVPDQAVVDALLAGTDRILALVDDAERSNEADVRDIVSRLRQGLTTPATGPNAAAGLPAEPRDRPQVSQTAGDLRSTVSAGSETRDEREARPVAVAPRAADRAASVRIPVPLVDRLMTLAGELVLVRNQAMRLLGASPAEIRPVLQRLDALTSQLQGAVTQTRMQPVGNLFARFPRTVRDLARQMGKAIELEVSGTEVELDKSVLELLSDPLTHLIRNCCDHGLETPEERARAGKPPAGRVSLGARQQGGQIFIEVGDDGRGIDPQRVKSKVLESGLRTAVELTRLSDQELVGLITLPGLSTATAVTDLSGRGVGMDVVQTNLEQLGGTLEIASTPGQGTRFSLRVPLTLAIIPCLMVRAGEQRYAIPQKDLEELVCLHPQQTRMRIEYTVDQEVVRLRGQLLPLVRLGEVLEHPRPFDAEAREALVRKYRVAGGGPASDSRPDDGPAACATTLFAVVKVGPRRFGLVVDEILKNEEIVVKPLHAWLKPLSCFSGATILGDGRVALILNMEGIVQHAGLRFGAGLSQRRTGAGAPQAEAAPALLFRYGPREQFAVPLAMLRRLVMIDPERIERVGHREFVAVDGVSTPLLRLDQVLPVSAGVEASPLFLLLPKNVGRPAGLVATAIVDTERLPSEFDRTAFVADGVVGSAILRGQMTLLLDLCRLAELGCAAAPAGPGQIAQARQKRILAVDDTEFFRELVRGYLQAEGYEVVTAADGVEALRILQEGQFDLVISDIEMPLMDGWALAEAIRGRAESARLPLLALTTLGSDADRARAKQSGYDGYEVKLDRQRLLETVAGLLRKHTAQATA